MIKIMEQIFTGIFFVGFFIAVIGFISFFYQVNKGMKASKGRKIMWFGSCLSFLMAILLGIVQRHSKSSDAWIIAYDISLIAFYLWATVISAKMWAFGIKEE